MPRNTSLPSNQRTSLTKLGSFLLLIGINIFFLLISSIPLFILVNNPNVGAEAMFYTVMWSVSFPLGIVFSVKLFEHLVKNVDGPKVNNFFIILLSCLINSSGIVVYNTHLSKVEDVRRDAVTSLSSLPKVSNESLTKVTTEADPQGVSSNELLYSYTLEISNPTNKTFTNVSLFVEVQLVNPVSLPWKLSTHLDTIFLEPGINKIPISTFIPTNGLPTDVYKVIRVGKLPNPEAKIKISVSSGELGMYKDYTIASTADWTILTNDPQVQVIAHEKK